MADELAELPPWAAWRHVGARDGLEVAWCSTGSAGTVLEGATTAVEDGRPWAVGHRIEVDGAWRTRRAEVWCRSPSGTDRIVLEAEGEGGWRVDGELRPDLDGALDIDLEACVLTNTLPVHRLHLHRSEVVHAPAAFVGVDLRVTRLDQLYQRRTGLSAGDGMWSAHYEAPDLAFTAELRFDRSGLVVAYPGLAERVG